MYYYCVFTDCQNCYRIERLDFVPISDENLIAVFPTADRAYDYVDFLTCSEDDLK